MAMNGRLSKKQKWFKEIVLTEEDELYVALDVHPDFSGLPYQFTYPKH
jgi:hypothetical protein